MPINTLVDATLTSGPAAASEARALFRTVCDELPATLADDVLLLISELVTNSVRHSGPASDSRVIGLKLLAGPKGMRVEVCDAGHGFPKALTPSTPDQQSGWGLQIVEKLSSRWGVDPGEPGSGSTVWFEIDF